MEPNDLDWKSGRVTYWDMGTILLDIPLADQLSELKEDLAQIWYPNGLLIDIGWHPEFSEEGVFLVTLIKDKDWEAPLMREACASAPALLNALSKAVQAAEQERRRKNS